MPSVHTWKSIELAESKGAWAGTPIAQPLWDLSKRELLEAALHLAAQVDGSPDNPILGAHRLFQEVATLRQNGLI